MGIASGRTALSVLLFVILRAHHAAGSTGNYLELTRASKKIRSIGRPIVLYQEQASIQSGLESLANLPAQARWIPQGDAADRQRNGSARMPSPFPEIDEERHQQSADTLHAVLDPDHAAFLVMDEEHSQWLHQLEGIWPGFCKPEGQRVSPSAFSSRVDQSRRSL